MAAAIGEMRNCSGPGPRVGAVVANGRVIIGTGHKAQGLHAERAAIEMARAAGHDLRGAELYTTLEPCVRDTGHRESCADLVARLGIGAVYIGRYDPNPTIHRLGWKTLRDAGIAVRDFDADLRSAIDSINQTFADYFVKGVGPTGGAKFDYQLNGGEFEIQFSLDDPRSIVTRWTSRGSGSIHAYAKRPVEVALGKYARDFDDIDDPGALDFTYTVPVNEGEIAVFRSRHGSVLVLVEKVEGGAHSGAAQRSVKIRFEVRAGAA